MRVVTFSIICTIYLFYGCSANGEKENPNHSSIVGNTNPFSDTNSKDSSWTYHGYNKNGVRIDITNHQSGTNFIIRIKHYNDSLDIDLNHLGNDFKEPEVIWVNDKMICIAVWWSGPFGRNLFVPIHNELHSYIYINKDIELADSLTNNIVFVDTVINRSKLVLTTENLITRKKKSMDIEITDENDEYPFYDSLAINNQTLKVWINGKQKNLDLKTIYPLDLTTTQKSMFDKIEGTYFDEICNLTIEISVFGDEYFYKYSSNERKMEGKVSFPNAQEPYLILGGIEFAEDYFDISLPEDDDEKRKEFERLKKIDKRTVGIECFYDASEDQEQLIIQNYGNAMVYYVKLYDCGQKYVHLIKV
ncbi:MAG: hypothetical protein H6582_01020 [Crocinitomicaceae bacterium]|nr:hypothetical protein [Crocinitomicaceae bacterium]